MAPPSPRDIPAYAKRKLHEELTRLLPGVFITLDFTHGHGVDTAAMQVGAPSTPSYTLITHSNPVTPTVMLWTLLLCRYTLDNTHPTSLVMTALK